MKKADEMRVLPDHDSTPPQPDTYIIPRFPIAQKGVSKRNPLLADAADVIYE